MVGFSGGSNNSTSNRSGEMMVVKVNLSIVLMVLE